MNRNDGVIVYLKKGLQYTYKNLFIGYCKATQLNISLENHKNLITCLYRSPSASEETFVDDLDRYLERTKQLNVFSQILVGDLNIKINTDSDIVQKYLNSLSEYNFISMINKYTRIQGSNGNCIDHIFLKCNVPNLVQECISMVFENKITQSYNTGFTCGSYPQ